MLARGSLTSASVSLWVVLAGCAESSGTYFSELTGVYTLQVPEGGTVSVREDTLAGTIRPVRAGILDLHPDWRFNLSFTARTDASWSSSGFYHARGEGLTLTRASGTSQSGTVSGETLTLNTGAGESLVFKKAGS